MSRLSPRVSRTLALALTLLLAALAYLLLVQPLIDTRSQAEAELADGYRRLAKYQSIAEVRPRLEQQLRQMQQRSSVDRAFLDAGSEALAVAALQQLVKRQVDANRGQLSRVQVNASRMEEGFRRISINVKLRIGEQGLAKMLYGLDQGAPVMFVDQLRIRSLQGGYPRRGNSGLELDVSFDLSGYQRTEASG